MTNIETKKSVEEITAFLAELRKRKNLDLADHLECCFSDEELQELDQDDPTSCFETLSDLLEEGGYFNIEITYYHNAMDYLKENDPSLMKSLSIVNEFGYAPDDLNSEILASLLASELERNKFYALRDDIEDFFTI